MLKKLKMYLHVKFHRKIDEYDRVHKNAKMDASTYLANPINAYLITKRLTKDWNDLQDSIFANEADGKFIGYNCMDLCLIAILINFI